MMTRLPFFRAAALFSTAAAIALAAFPLSAQSVPSPQLPEFSLAKRPWLAAGEIVGINFVIWAYDRYVKFEPWAYISWETMRRNFRPRLEWDRDLFSTNFFGHPYHGALFYNSARSSGFSFWEAGAFSLGGSLSWEFFFENNPPSINDLLTTTFGGAYLGEILYRFSSLVLDDTAAGLNRILREVAASLINPARGVNRLLSGESWRRQPVNRQIREPLRLSLSISKFYLARWADWDDSAQNLGIGVDLLYGDRPAGRLRDRPFDWFVFSGQLRFGEERLLGGIHSYAVLSGRNRIGPKGGRYLLGLFQHFDYLVNEYFKMAGIGLAEGVISTIDYGNGRRIETSVQLGALLGASVNDYTLIEERDYTYGLGPMLKVDALFDLAEAGTASLRFAQFVFFTIAGTVGEGTASVNWVSQAQGRYFLRLRQGFGARLELGWFRRSTLYEQAQRITRNQVRLGLSAVFAF